MAHIQQLMDMGFSEGDARRALQQVNGNVEQAIERLLSGVVGGEPEFPPLANEATPNFDRFLSGNSQDVSAPQPPTESFQNYATGLEADALNSGLPLEPRKEGLPCGLRNVGNTCYVNSLLQTFLHVDEFRDQMLCYRTPAELEEIGRRPSGSFSQSQHQGGEPESEDNAREESAEKRLRRTHGVFLASELRRLFACGLLTDRSCIDPSHLLAQLVDRRGQKLPIGSQEDVGEFMLKLLEQLEEGLRSGDFMHDAGSAGSSVQASPQEPAAAQADAARAAEGPAVQAPDAAVAADATMSDDAETDATGGALSDLLDPARREGAAATGAGAAGAGAEGASAGAGAGAETDGKAAPKKSPAQAEAVDEKKALSLLQSFFFGEQVHFFSYRATPPSALASPCASEAGTDITRQAVAPTLEALAAHSKQAGGLADVPMLPRGEGVEASPKLVPSVSPAGSECGAGPEVAAEQAAVLDMPAVPPAVPLDREKSALPVPDANGMVISEERSDFLHIFLDVKHKTLYRAWEAARNTEVDDYKTPFGRSTKASTSTWIKRLPKLLFFQLQRVTFDQETKNQVKLDDAFEFEKRIYVDRFLLPNRDRAQEAAAHVRHLQEEKDKLEEAVCGFGTCKGRSNLAVSDVLTWAAEYLDSNASAKPGSTALPEPSTAVAVNSATSESLRAELKRGAPSAVALLKSLSDLCTSQVSQLRADADRLGGEIDEAYSDLRKEAYELYAIWVHSGIAGSGHFWAFIRDWQQEDRWYRLDDARVTVVPWPDVRDAAVGKEGSHTSAYVLVYVDGKRAAQQRIVRDRTEVLRETMGKLPNKLIRDIELDNERFKEEQKQNEIRQAEQELRRHAEAIFQNYAGLIHVWDGQKRVADSTGNAMDPQARKNLHDAALLSFDLFLYRAHGEQDVWTHLLTKSIETQRDGRKWKPEDEGRILYFLAGTLRSQQCYFSMLRDVVGPTGSRCCELQPIDDEERQNQYITCLLQAHIIDEAVQSLKDKPGLLVKTVSMLAFIWARWQLDNDDKFRQNEVLLLMSTLIYNTVNVLERGRSANADISFFSQPAEYFLILLHAVEWPKSWKTPLIARVKALFPSLDPFRGRIVPDLNELKEMVLNHQNTREEARHLPDLERRRPEPGEQFFQRHKDCYAWVMIGDERIAQEYVLAICPDMPGVRNSGLGLG